MRSVKHLKPIPLNPPFAKGEAVLGDSRDGELSRLSRRAEQTLAAIAIAASLYIYYGQQWAKAGMTNR